jgi:hypothetical protein
MILSIILTILVGVYFSLRRLSDDDDDDDIEDMLILLRIIQK